MPGTGWGSVDVDDVMAVLDHALASVPVLRRATGSGMLGGSYGGYMATMLAGPHGDRFKAICSERAVNNMVTEEFSSDIAHDVPGRSIGADPVEDPDEYERMSPIRWLRDITVPMLIIHSEDDYRCPINQAEELFVALRLLGKDVTFYRFPGESHELSRSGSPVHRTPARRDHPRLLRASTWRPSPEQARRRSACGRSRSAAGSSAGRRGGTTGRRRSRRIEHDLARLPRRAEADHQAVRERPRLAGAVAHVADLDADLLAHLAHDAPSSDSPGSTNPARQQYIGPRKLHAVGEQRLAIVVAAVTRVIIAGASRGNADSPHAGQFIARSPACCCVGVPHRPQNRCVRAHSTSCTARPATNHSTSPDLPKNE